MPDEKPTPSPSATPDKSDVQRGVEGLERQGRSGTVNENAERQMKEIDRAEKGDNGSDKK